ncbi:nuclear transport factor 2 family protein [Hyalangium rubrum]|uniref:Nuclear transport factor 2 family protein n=1 Tax=Hyalangium rubrum TaxID=3103134 RepID=A0ABU5HE41_9BACT|nr:nuclear transport factor 2 family protein [Hyalangium sp. s54d21]MDY7231723.1 nuclear transport factor 2 family protein [Hyalangium sp. s54d21]
MTRLLPVVPLLISGVTCATTTPGEAAAPPGAAAIRLHPGAEPPSPELVAQLEELDLKLFDAVFGCRLDTLASLIAEDFEFVHDKWGQTADSGPAFVESVRQGCEKQKTGENFTARRELVPGTMTVHVLKGYGAMQMGTHRFFALQPGRPDRLTETGKFIDLWKKQQDGSWKLARVISYDHRLAQAGD